MDINIVRQSAADAYRYARQDDSRMKEKIITFYREGKENPSVAKVIASKATADDITLTGEYLQDDIRSLRGKPFMLLLKYVLSHSLAGANLEMIKKDPDVEPFYEQFEKSFKTLYPKYHKLREKLILDKRISLGKITPCMPKGIKKYLKYAKFM